MNNDQRSNRQLTNAAQRHNCSLSNNNKTMSDDSSASSVDSILNSPVPIKKDGRAKRAEKLKMDFFDECLNGTNARADIHRRIAVVESEIKADACEKVDDGDGNDGIKKESPAGGNVNGSNSKSNSDSVKEEETTSTNNGETKPQIKRESEDSYWARVEQFTAETSTVKRSRGVEYDSETDDEEEWKDGVGVSRTQKRGEMAAKLTGGQSGLGLRRVFGKSKSKAGDVDGVLRFYVFQSREEALDDLVVAIGKLNEGCKHSQCTSEKLMYQHFIRPLSKLLKSKHNLWGRGMHSICRFFDRNPVTSSNTHIQITCECKPACILTLPDTFVQWIWKVSCSSLGSNALEAKCSQLLRKFMQHDQLVHKNQCTFDIARESLKKFQMGNLAICLTEDFGLITDSGSVDSSDEKLANENSESTNESCVDVTSLNRLFMLWSSLVERDYVQLDETDVIGEGATKDVVALARACVDPHLELATQRYITCGNNMLLDTMQCLLSSIVKSTSRQIANKFDQEKVHEWLEHTAISIIESCGAFSAGDEDAADNDDAHGYLPWAAVISNMQCRDDVLRSKEVSNECALLRVHMAEKALAVCLTEIKNLDEQVAALKNSRCDSWGKCNDADESSLRTFSDHAFTGFLTSEVVFRWIDERKDYLLQDLPRLLAIVYIAGECVMASARIFYRLAAPSNQSDIQIERFVRYSVEEKDGIYDTLTRIQDHSDSLRGECGRRSVISFPHLRRTKEYLTRLTKCIDGFKGRSSKEKRQRRRAQGSLDCFFRSSQDDEFSPSPLR